MNYRMLELMWTAFMCGRHDDKPLPMLSLIICTLNIHENCTMISLILTLRKPRCSEVKQFALKEMNKQQLSR